MLERRELLFEVAEHELAQLGSQQEAERERRGDRQA
jgi:hypothetical protein